MGLQELVDITMQLVPEGSQRAFTAAQKADIELKTIRSHTIVASAASAAAGLAAVTIPFTESAVLVPIQIGMIAGITATFGLSVREGFIASLLASISAVLGTEYAVRELGIGLIKLVPGVGTLAGGALSGATAATITTILGETYISVLKLKFTQNEGESPDPNEVIEALKEKLSIKLRAK
ncbi:MAG: hypothetical protein F6K10_42690 [Moorea sp. SIO2B7]|nr:hypothetical protein [Moorena sp. SIO2B7]